MYMFLESANNMLYIFYRNSKVLGNCILVKFHHWISFRRIKYKFSRPPKYKMWKLWIVWIRLSIKSFVCKHSKCFCNISASWAARKKVRYICKIGMNWALQNSICFLILVYRAAILNQMCFKNVYSKDLHCYPKFCFNIIKFFRISQRI